MRTATTAARPAVRSSFCLVILLLGILMPLVNGKRTVGQDEQADEQADRLFGRAGQAQNAGDFEFAAELWDQFLKEHPTDPQAIKARHYAGVCRMTLKQYDRAIAAFSSVVADEKADNLPQLEETYYYLGWCQFNQGQQGDTQQALLEKAIETFNQHIEKFEQGKLLDQAYFLKGESLYFLGRKKDSIAAYSKVVSDFKESSSRSSALYALGVSQFETQDFSAARSTFDQFLAEFANDPLTGEIRLFRAESLLQQAISLSGAKEPSAAERANRDKLLDEARQSFAELAADKSFAQRDQALFNQAVCESQLENWDQAAKLYASVATEFEKSPLAASARMSAGKLYLRLNDLANAEKWMRAAAQSDPAQAAEAWHWYCQALLRQGKAEAARQAAADALPKATDDDFRVRLKMDLGDAQYASADSKADSIATYLEIVDQHPEHPVAAQSLYNAAFTCLELKRFEDGLKWSERFLEKFPEDAFLPDVLYVKAECLLLSKKPAEAAKVFRDLLDSHAARPERPVWQVRYGLCLYLQDQYEPAIQFLDAIIDQLTQPEQQAEALFLVGASHFYRDEFAPAVDKLRKATANGQKLKQIDEALVLLAQALAAQEQFAAAMKPLEELINNYTDSAYLPQAQYLAGQYLATGMQAYDRAIEKYDAVLGGKPNKYTPYAAYGKAWALLNTKQNEQAEQALTGLIENHPEHDLLADAFYSRAVAQRRLVKYQAAVADIDRCLEIAPQFRNLVSALYEKGMALSADKKYPAAIEAFQRLTTDFADHEDADEFLYQLAWAFKSNADDDKAVGTFQKLTEKFPESETAGEAHYHVAEDLYRQKKYDEAIRQYELAEEKADAREVDEKASYKRAWSHYQKNDFEQARDGFASVVAAHGQGDLADSSRFMIAECWYQQDKFAEAFAEFGKILPDVVNSQQTNATEKALACLHGAESANKVRKYDQAIKWIEFLQNDLKDQDYVAPAWLELGNARRGLQEFDAAIAAFSKAFDLANNETGARAGFLVGEVYFQQKKFEEAIRQYKLVIYGYGGTKAPESIKKWQSSSGYETARCYHVQIKDEPSATEKRKLLADAQKFYQYVIENHPQDRLAVESRKQLDVLEKLNL